MISADKNTILQILGSLMKKPDLLDLTDQYYLTVDDFSNKLEKYIFSTINNLFLNGATIITEVDIDNYLKDNPQLYTFFTEQKGIEFLQDALEISELENFNYYYNKLKKINCTRDLSKMFNVDNIYCEDILNPKKQEINDKFEQLSVQNIVAIVKGEVANVESKYLFGSEIEIQRATSNAEELLNELMVSPEVGSPLQGDIFNTIVRGARKGKYYIQSSPTNVGKSRTMVGNACYLAFPVRYDSNINRWVNTGSCEKVLYIATEQDLDEIQTMMWSYLTDINEDKFTYGLLNEEELERAHTAIDIIKQYEDNFIFVNISDPNIAKIKALVRQNVIKYNIDNVFYDYIFSSPNLLGEFRDLHIREDVALMMLSTALKDLAVELSIFVMTATQVSGDIEQEKGIKNYKYIRGAKSIVDKCDIGYITTRVHKDELNMISKITEIYGKVPNQVSDVYKVRRGKWVDVRIWSYVDLGTCRREDLFITDANYMEIDNFNVIKFVQDVKDEDKKYMEQINNNRKYQCSQNNASMMNFIEQQTSNVDKNININSNNNSSNNNLDWSDLLY